MNIINASEIDHKKTTYLIYGGQGVGKTTSLKYLPGKTLIVDIDKSSSVLKGEKNIDIAEIDTSNIWEEWNKIVAELIKNPEYEEKYDNIVIDNISELFRSSLENLGKLGKVQQGGVPGIQDYQKVDFLILRAIRALNKLNVRLIFTAWETTTEFNDGLGQIFNKFTPDIRKAIHNNVLGLMDVVARLTIRQDEDGEVKRGFILQPSNNVDAKNRLDSRKGCLVEELVQDKADDVE